MPPENEQAQEAKTVESSQVEQTTVQNDSPPEGEQFDAEYVKKLRAENASWRTKFQDAQRKLTEQEQQQSAKYDAIVQRMDAIDAERNALIRERQEREARAIAQEIGLIDPETALKLVSQDDLVMDENGKMPKLANALRELAKEKPYLLGDSSGGSTNPNRGNTNRLTLDDIKKMSRAEINSRWDEIEIVLAGK